MATTNKTSLLSGATESNNFRVLLNVLRGPRKSGRLRRLGYDVGMTKTASQKPRMGRPPLPPEEKRDEVIRLKATSAEREAMQAGASRAGVELSTWLRELGLKAAARSARES